MLDNDFCSGFFYRHSGKRDGFLWFSAYGGMAAKGFFVKISTMTVCLCAGLCGACFAGNSANLVKNGSFSKGQDGKPVFWSGTDGITTFWDRAGNPGRCLLFDTSVQQSDKREHKQDPAAFKGRKKGGQYGTVGAHEGVWAFSSPIEVKAADRYFIIEANVNGPAKSSGLFYPQVFIRGYQKFDSKRDAGTSSWFQTPHAGGPA